MKNKIIIIGKIPPPVGGVTVHVSRLIASLVKRKYRAFYFYDLEKESLLKLFLTISHYKAAHLHTSNPYFQLILAAFCRLVKTKLIITYHGNWGRYRIAKNLATYISSYFTLIPILQNQESYLKSQKFNKQSVRISAFIPPFEIFPLGSAILQNLTYCRKRYKYLFCTNASNLAFDKTGKEIYGISDLVQKFSKTSNSALIISDPSGNNKKYLKSSNTQLPDNVCVITSQHDFWNILQFSDAFIRNTTTDGDSISIHEALCCGITVFATQCVPRPSGCNLYREISEINFEAELERIKSCSEKIHDQLGDTVMEILLEYEKCLVLF